MPIVQVILVILFKKKKKKKEKNDPYFGMGKNTKVMPQKPRYLSFPWEREGILHLGLYKIQNLVRFLPCPPARKYFSSPGTVWMTHTKKFTQN